MGVSAALTTEAKREVISMIAEMPPAQQAKIHECADRYRALRREYADAGTIAFALVALEIEEEMTPGG